MVTIQRTEGGGGIEKEGTLKRTIAVEIDGLALTVAHGGSRWPKEMMAGERMGDGEGERLS